MRCTFGCFVFAFSFATLSILGAAASAATLVYDADLVTAGPQDGAGAGWNTANSNFWDGATNVPWPNTTADEAVFGAGSGAAGTVQVGTVNVNTITFSAAGSGNYTLSGAGAITFGGTSPTIATNADATIATKIVDDSGFTKTGSGMLTLSAANTFTGSVYVNQGIVKIGRNGLGGPGAFGARDASPAKVIIAAGATVDLNGYIDSGYGYTIAGTGAAGTGAIINTGGHIGNSTLQTSNITLSADAMIGGTGNFALLAPGHAATTLDLAAHTLTKAGTNTFTISNATFTAGNIHIAQGTFSQCTRAHNASMVAFTLDDAAGATLALGGFDLSVGSLAGGGATGGNVNLDANTLTVGGLNTSTTYAGAISGTGGNLTKTGSGTLTLNGANTLTGTVRVQGGILKIGHHHAFGEHNTAVSKVIVASGATVDFNGIGDAAYGYTIAGTGVAGQGALINTGAAITPGTKQISNLTLAANATIGGSGSFALVAPDHDPNTLDLAGYTLTKSGSNVFGVSDTTFTAGTIHIAGGTFTQYRQAHDASMVAFTFANAAGANLALGGYDLEVGSLAGGGSTGGSIALGGSTLTVGDLDTSTTYAGIISGSGGLIKVGLGTLTLSGDNTFTGAIHVNEGILKVGHTDALGADDTSVAKVIVADGATVDLGGIIDAKYGYTIAGTGALGTGAIINTGNHIGNSTLQSTNIQLAADAMIGGTGNFALLAQDYAATTLDLATHTLTKAGTNTFTVVNTTFKAGTVRVAEGTFTQDRRAHDASMVAFTLDDAAGATLALGGFDLSVGSLAGGGATGGNVNLGANTLTVGGLNTSTTYAGAISGTGGNLAKTGSGTLVLGGANTYSGTTTISDGTLQVDGTHTGGGLYSVNGGGTLAGTGIIDATVSIDAGGVHSPGSSVGAQTVSNEVWNSGGAFQLEINDATGTAGGPNGWDLLTIDDGSGTGTLDISSLSASSPFSITLVSLDAASQPGDIENFVSTQPCEWEFATFDVLNGAFSADLFTIDASGFTNDLGAGYFTVIQTTGGLAIGFVPEPSTLLIGLMGILFALCRRRR